ILLHQPALHLIALDHARRKRIAGAETEACASEMNWKRLRLHAVPGGLGTAVARIREIRAVRNQAEICVIYAARDIHRVLRIDAIHEKRGPALQIAGRVDDATHFGLELTTAPLSCAGDGKAARHP